MSTDPASSRQLARARALLEINRAEEAKQILSSLVGTDPASAGTWRLMSLALLRTNDPANALVAAGSAVAREPDNEWGHRLAAYALLHLGRPHEAWAAANTAVACAPNSWAAHVCRAETLCILRRPGPAESSARQAIKLGPHQSGTYVCLGQVLLARGRPRDAEAAFYRALAVDPQDFTARHELARAHLAQGKQTKAIGGFAAAAAGQPQKPVARQNVQAMLRSLGTRIALIVIFGTFLTAQVMAGGDPADKTTRVWVAVLLVATAAAVLLTIARVPPSLRKVIVPTVRRSRRLMVLFALACLGLLTLVATAVMPSAATGLAGVNFFVSAAGTGVAALTYRTGGG